MVDQASIDSEQTFVFKGTVRDFVYQGETAYVLATTGDQQMLTFRFGTDSSSAQKSLNLGDDIELGLNRRDVIIIPE